jgi:predicted AAA+ superfamily ATPase
MESRELYTNIWWELASNKSMILLSGPRQAGKTTLARMIADSYTNSLYFNWDIPQNKTRLIETPTFFEDVERKDATTPLIIFDEMHKYRDWKNYLKGVYDGFHDRFQFLVSGSGRLDLYRRGGDSLAGRYFLFHLWPFTIAEMGKRNVTIDSFLNNPLQMAVSESGVLKETWKRLSELSGFPEPYLTNKPTSYRRWSNTYSQQLIREDIRDMTDVKAIHDIEILYTLLPSKVGSPVSIPSFVRDLKASYNTIQNWLAIFERFFLIFSIGSWSRKIARAISKERKVYLWDTPRIKEPAARFENMVALELWRAVTAWNDMGHGLFSLHFIKNKDKQEVDFLIANEHEPFLLVEAKLTDTQPSPALRKFQYALKVPAVQLTGEGEGYRLLTNEDQHILVAPAYQWLSQLP